MFSRALTLNEVRGRSLSMMTPPPVSLIEGISHSGSPLPCPGPPSLSSSPPPPPSPSLALSPPLPHSFSPPPLPHSSSSPSSSTISSVTPPSDSPPSSCSSPPSGISPSPFPPMSSSPPPPPPPPPAAAPPPGCFAPPSFNPPAPLPAPAPPCCPCASLLPRLLAAHRLEVRRLLRGALASLGRRLDSLERRSSRKRRRRRRRRGAADGSPASCSAPPPPATSSSSSSSSDSEELPPHPPSLKSPLRRRRIEEEEEEEEDWVMEERRRPHRGAAKEEEEEEEEDERFVGRMAVSFRGRSGGGGGAAEEEEEELLTLHSLSKRRRRKVEPGGSQSEKSAVIAKNGFSQPIRLSSQDALHFLQSVQTGWTFGQSEAFAVSPGQWRFPDLARPDSSSLSLWLSRAPRFSPAPMLRLSAGAVDSLLESVKGGVFCRPHRRLTDRTAPPSLGSDHCYIRLSNQSPAFSARRQQKQRANHSSRSHHLRRHPLPPCLPNGLSAALPSVQSAASSKLLSTNLERGKRVSQIRIRRASPRETPLTPMGLPKVKRVKKKDFSLEEIYTNKNYKSPTTNRSLETIFEEPREKDGALFVIGQQKKRRLLLFPDFTQPRKRKKLQGAGLGVGLVNRKRARRHMHGCDDEDLDVMLVERLSALEDFLSRQGLDL